MNTSLVKAGPTAMKRTSPPRRRGRNYQAVKAGSCAAIALMAGFVFNSPHDSPSMDPSVELGGFSQEQTYTVTAEPPAIADLPLAFGPATMQEPEAIEQIEPEPEPEPVPEPNLLGEMIPLDHEAQMTIWDMCHHNSRLFCTVMAIAKKESQFQTDIIGDGGNSIGMMQINTYWQRDRIQELGITDLTDYRQNMSVALDYIHWIADNLAPEEEESVYGTHTLFMCYNAGYWGALDLLKQGIDRTQYSKECLTYYTMFMGALEVGV